MRFTDDDIRQFATWSADRNPLHVDPAFATDTHFGQCLAHGVLSVLRALAASGRGSAHPLTRIDVEFRGAVVPGISYDSTASASGNSLSVAVHGPDGAVLTLHATTGSRGDDLPAPDAEWAAAAAGRRLPTLRDQPAVRSEQELETGVEASGRYRTEGPLPASLAGGVRVSEAQALALCSYVVGMELPGQRSLFTKLSLALFDAPDEAVDLLFRARAVRFDRHFRVLDIRVDIASADGRAIGTGLLRSYVPLGHLGTDVGQLAGHVDTAGRLAGKVAFVAGGSRGLGSDIAASLALAGCRVYVAARSASAAAQLLRNELAARGQQLELLTGDVRDARWCQSVFDEIRSRHGRLDVVVLNACAPPSPLRLTAGATARHQAYIRDNLELVSTPLAGVLPALQESHGSVVYVSSSFVDKAPPGFSHYVALKQAGEGLVGAALQEWPAVSAIVARPPRLLTSWNDTPTGVAGAIPAAWAAVRIVEALAARGGEGAVRRVTEFPPLPQAAAPAAAGAPPKTFPVRVVSSFTLDPLVPGLRFWLRNLGIRDDLFVAPYGQVLQSLLDPGSPFASRGGLNVVLLRTRDWLRELPPEQSEAIEFLRPFLRRMSADLDAAMRAHCGRGAGETLLVLCPSLGAASAAESILLTQTETELADGLKGLAGLTIVRAADFHARYAVNEDEIRDPLREKLAHIPYLEAYYHTLATIVARHVHRRTAPVRKVVVVDCDNTLWSGVVGEAGAEGVEFHPEHRALHETLTRLSANGVLVCLCSKNEEADVWRVFETRPDFGLRREDVVAARINWLPKSENLRALAARLNLGIDSFIFLDDNPVECAEVRARCPEVLTLQWPLEGDKAQQLLAHAWELDASQGTREDAKRAQMYKEEFKRQEFREGTNTFADFMDSLGLEVTFSPLVPEDLRRASQLTLRTNQFNFTTVRREEADVRALADDGHHQVRTIRVRDRFGDYGLVGLVIADVESEALVTDTFLLSCRVLGRGVEHRIASELGRIAVEAGRDVVRIQVNTTERNTPARQFLDSIAGMGQRFGDLASWGCDFPAAALADLRFTATEQAMSVADDAETPAAAAAPVNGGALRSREEVIAHTAFDWSNGLGLQAAIEGRPAAAVGAGGSDGGDVATAVCAAFARTLRISEARVREVDSLEALGCDSLKIVEITVALLEKYPWLPSTLLFEHRTVGGILKEVAQMSGAAARRETAPAAAPHPIADRAPGAVGDIAVVGMHLRCAGANSPDELWDLLSSGRSAVGPVDANRRHFLHTLVDGRPHFAGLIDDADRFDAEFFGISPREAEFVDPQLRLLLEVAWNAFEDAGSGGARQDDATGVFVGVMYGDYGPAANAVARAKGYPYRCWEGFSLANRVSQLLGLHGPSLAVDTACSSSGTALHLAVRALRDGDCRAALVGGVNLILDPDRLGSLGRLGILSTTGACEPFGAAADGTVLGEGAAAVVLRPLADALARGDRIYGVIKGTGLSTGSGTIGFTAPNPQAQAEAIRHALEAARVDPRTISYVETHGTGTALGDPIEVRGLTLAYTDQALMDSSAQIAPRCRIGSIKPNVGHIEAGAGLVGLIKVLLQLHRRALVPSLTSPQPNPHIPFGEIPFEVQTALEPWEPLLAVIDGQRRALPRRAGLSSFGVGGANAHVIVEEAPAPAPRTAVVDRPVHVLALSAPDEKSLARQTAAVRDFVAGNTNLPLADLAFSLDVGRHQFAHRLAVPATRTEDLAAALDQVLAGRTPAGAAAGVVRQGSTPRIAFLFTGQGSQYAGMARQLYDTQPVFRAALDRCARVLTEHLGEPLLEPLLAAGGDEKAALLNQTQFTQPALFAFEWAFSELWRSWGIEPAVVMGHSVGEISAMCVAGGVSLDDGLKLIAARGRLMQSLPPGGSMTSVSADEARVLEAIAGADDQVAIAAVNTPGQTVISGAGVAVAAIASKLEADGIKTKPLVVSHAFHSPLMRPMLAEYQRVVRSIAFGVPTIPFISCVDGALVTQEVTRPDYWIRQVTDPVRFAAGMAVAEAQRIDAYVELGPHPVLLGLGRECTGDRGESVAWLPSLRRDRDAWPTLLASVARLYTMGAPVDWAGFDGPYSRSRVRAPGYAFAKKSYWLRDLPAGMFDAAPRSVAHEAVNTTSSVRDLMFETAWRDLPVAAPQGAQTERRWVLIGPEDATRRALAARLEKAGRVSVVAADPCDLDALTRAMREIQPGPGAPLTLVHLWAATGDRPSDDLGRSNLVGAAHLVQAARRAGVAAPIWFVTRGAVDPSGTEPIALDQAPLWGLARTMALEHPESWGGLVDLPAEAPEAAVAVLAEALRADDDEDQIAIRQGRRLVARLVPRPAPRGASTLRADGTYLVTGGTGALGLRVARWLVSKGARHLVLASRRGSDEAAAATVAELRAGGAEALVVTADVAVASDVARLVNGIDDTAFPLRGVFHLAGVDALAPVDDITPAHLSNVLAAKAGGGWHLHEHTRGRDLDTFVVFSSMSSVLGSHGRGGYGAANAFLDGLVAERRRLGLPAIGVNWGPWAGGGMARPEQLDEYRRIGNRGLEPAEALALLDRLMAEKNACALVADIDWNTFGPVYEARRARPLVSDLTGAAAAEPKAPASGWIAELEPLPATARPARLTELLRAEVAEVLGFDRSDDLPLDRDFYDAGMDSLMMADLVGRLKQRLGLLVSAPALDRADVVSLAAHLLERLSMAGPAAARTEAVAAPSDPGGGRIVPYEPARRDALMAFYREAFPDRDPALLAARFEWMVRQSAARIGAVPHAWLYEDGGRVVGHMSSIAVQLAIGNETRATEWFVDTRVLDSHRQQALGTQLMVDAQAQVPLALSLGQTPEMRQIQFRLGWHQVAPLQTAQLLIRPERVLRGKMPAPLAWAAGVGFRASTKVRARRSASAARVCDVARFGIEHDDLWRRMSREVGCAVVRDASYLNWKYVDQPGQLFHRLAVLEGGAVQAVAVWMMREADEHYRYRRAFLVDLVVPPSQNELVLRAIEAVCEAAAGAGADAVTCMHVGGWLTQALRQSGFLIRTPERFLLVLPGGLPPEARDAVLTESSWYATQGDSDIDRP